MDKIKNPFKEARTKYNQHGNESVKTVAEKTGITKSLIDDLEATSGKKRGVSYLIVAQLAKYYGVPADYLMGLPTPDLDMMTMREYTGLSEETIEYLHRIKDDFPQRTATLNELLTAPGLDDILLYLANIRGYCKRIPPFVDAIINDALSDESTELLGQKKSLANCQLKIYYQRQKFHGEMWDFTEAVKKLADDLYSVYKLEDYLNKKYQYVKDKRIAAEGDEHDAINAEENDEERQDIL